MTKTYREQLADLGGWNNALVGVPAGAVREIIEALEDRERQVAALRVVAEKAARLLAEIGPGRTDLCGYHQMGFDLAAAICGSTVAAAAHDAAKVREGMERAAKVCMVKAREYQAQADNKAVGIIRRKLEDDVYAWERAAEVIRAAMPKEGA